MEDAGFEFEGEELWHMGPADYRVRRRLPEFAADWTLASDLPSQVQHHSNTCFYNIPRCIAGENDPSESIEVEKQEDPREVETAVLVAGIVVGFLGLVAGIVFIVMSKMEPPAV
ncbi:uncharacterized protein si:ch73-31d8.2 [Xyrauchen texanus]|uniref:uncharacterized protein si:ch73-31d8.2 n=1 Tax=Xyrauchen texanus TaxID=154827 RepID=UPI002241DFD4|nr:uncharacterized protein si:ch73-31d8.2 [Xyrauchen texanus]XP_052000403.1 uncharacterized protein si:ch73-31d8.2 [Xyrauchen texanus]